MIWFATFFMFGAAFGEIVLLALWLRKPESTLAAYWLDKRGDVILSGAMAAITCTAWSEGTLTKLVIDHWSLDLEQTLGFSVIVGACVCVFARPILGLAGRLLSFRTAKGDS